MSLDVHNKKHYQNVFSNSNKSMKHNGYRIPLTAKLRKKIFIYAANQLNINRSVSILDAGCGNGLFFNEVVKKLFKINYSCGIDFVEEATISAQEFFDETKNGSVVNISNLTDKKFDIINSMEVFLYIPYYERKEFFYQHIDALKPNGYFFLTVPNLKSIYRMLIKPEKSAFPYDFDYETIITHLNSLHNLEIINIYGINIFGHVTKVTSFANKLFAFEFLFLIRKVK